MATNVGVMAIAIALIGIIVGAGSYVYAGQSANTAVNALRSTELNQARSDLSNTKSEIEELESKVSKTQKELEKVVGELGQIKSQLSAANSEISQSKSQFQSSLDKDAADLKNIVVTLSATNVDLNRTRNMALSSYMRILIDKIVEEAGEVKDVINDPKGNLTRKSSTVRGPVIGTLRDAPWPAAMKPAADKAIAVANDLNAAMLKNDREASKKAFKALADELNSGLFRAFRTWASQSGTIVPRLEFDVLEGGD